MIEILFYMSSLKKAALVKSIATAVDNAAK